MVKLGEVVLPYLNVWHGMHNKTPPSKGINYSSVLVKRCLRGLKGLEFLRSGRYNVTVAGAAGGRGICSIQRGRGLLWKGVVELSDAQDLLISIGQKGVEPCEVMKDIPVCENPPKTLIESSKCFQQWRHWLDSNLELSQSEAATTIDYGGGGGGGGATLLRVYNRTMRQFSDFPIVVAGGGGGSAADLSLSILYTLNLTSVPDNSSPEDAYTSFIDAKDTDRDIALESLHNFTGIRGYISNSVDIFNNRAGAGGGYFPAVSLQQDGSSLSEGESFALGGFDCLHLSTDLTQRPLFENVHGGFGGGGGQCESGGSGGGYTGGSIFSNKYYGIPGNGGFYNYFSAPQNNVIELNIGLNPELDGFVEVVPSDCGCGYKCIG